jgi:predicted nuclease of predicted toxin-antitoxin system
MKLLLDANISWKLVSILNPVFGECVHVDSIGLTVPAEDKDIWDYALKNGYIIITKDNDFLDLLEIKGFPPKVVLLKTGNNSSKALADLLINAKSKMEDMENNEYGLLEIYGPLKLLQKS